MREFGARTRVRIHEKREEKAGGDQSIDKLAQGPAA